MNNRDRIIRRHLVDMKKHEDVAAGMMRNPLIRRQVFDFLTHAGEAGKWENVARLLDHIMTAQHFSDKLATELELKWKQKRSQ